MIEREVLAKTIRKLELADEKMTVTAVQVQEAIKAYKMPQWLKAVLLWLAAWTLKKRGIWSFLRAYLSIVGVWLITRPGLWIGLIRILCLEDTKAGKALIAIIEFFDGTLDYVVLWVLTGVVVLVATYHFIIAYRKHQVKDELKAIINEISFNPEKDWFDKKCKTAIRTLGERYSSENNFKNPALSSVYKALTSSESLNKKFKKALEAFVKACRHEYDHLPKDVKEKRQTIETKINGIVEIYNNKCNEQYAAIYQHAQDILDEFDNILYTENHALSTYGYDKVMEAHRKLADYEALCQFTSNPVLYVKGDAGTGKSHLLADIVSIRMKRGMKSLLALGLNFVEMGDVKNRLMEIWGVKGTWDDFLIKLDRIGELEGYSLLIVIDGVNEGLGNQLWPNAIAGIEAEVLQYEHLGLVVSARTFSGSNILNPVSEGKATITLEGFRGMEDEAITYMTGKFGVTLPNVSKHRREFSNPLFLKLYCKAYSDAGKPMPDSFLDVVKNYISKVNEKLAEKYGYQANMFNYAQQVADAMTQLYMTQGGRGMNKFQKLSDLLARTNAIIPGGNGHNFVQDMVSEGVLMSFNDGHGEVLVDFNFDLVGDYLYAEALLNNGWTQYIGKRVETGVMEATCVLLPLMKGVEIVNYLATDISQSYRETLFERTLKQRFSISDDAKIGIRRIMSQDLDKFYDILPILTTHAECRDIIEDANAELKAMSMAERDQKWSMHFTIRTYDAGNTELISLARWAAGLSRNSTRTMSNEVAYLMSSVLFWGFSSPYRILRDIATKAVINVLQDKPEVLTMLIDQYDDVNDPYIQERLYAVAHGSTLRGDCGMSGTLAKKIYEKVFDVDNVRPDILLRDYARCAVDYIAQNVALPDVNLDKIIPPYGVTFSFANCPDRNTVEGKYRLEVGPGVSEEQAFTQNKILSSMETEYSNGTGGYGDFGRYTFESAMRSWDDCDDYSAPLLRNYALEIIFGKYKFDAAVYWQHDYDMVHGRGSRPAMERFGKKYQWIAMHEILGLMQDNYQMESGVSNDKAVQCDGTWDPHVRDIDTTTTFIKYAEDDQPTIRDEEKEWLHKDTLPYEVKHEDKWLRSKEGMSKEIVKKTIEVTDDEGEKWIVLYGYNTLTPKETTLVINETQPGLWEFIQAYIAPRKQRKNLVDYISKKGTQGRSMPEYRNNIYELYYKDYYRTASYREFAKRSGIDDESEFEETRASYQISYRPYTCEGEMTANRLSKQLFDLLGLKDGERIGEYVDGGGRIIAFDPSVNYQNDGQLVVRKRELQQALKSNGLSVVWPVLFEKQRGTAAVGDQFGGVAYMTDSGKIKVKLRHYVMRQDNPKRRYRKVMVEYYAKLVWYTLTMNKAERVRNQMKIRTAKMMKKRGMR